MNAHNFIQCALRREAQGVHQILCFFPRIFESLPPLPRQHSAAIGCTKNGTKKVHSYCVESSEGLLQRRRRGRGCSAFRKKHNVSEHPVEKVFGFQTIQPRSTKNSY